MSNKLIEDAKREGAPFLSEAQSKELLTDYQIPVGKMVLTKSLDEALGFAHDAGYPLVLKGCGRTILHKTELGLVEVGIRDQRDLTARFKALLSRLPDDADGVLVCPMLETKREFIAGLSTDPQFGPVVMFGLGGIFAEAMKDVAFRVCPILKIDAMEMIESINSSKLLGEIRGLPTVDKGELCNMLMALSLISEELPQVTEIDINPILFDKGRPVAADALVKIG